MSANYDNAIRDPDHGLPHAQVCFDPFHVVNLESEKARRSTSYAATSTTSTGARAPRPASGSKGTRYSLLKDTARQTPKQRLKLAEVVTTNQPLYRAFLLYGELRYTYKLPKRQTTEQLSARAPRRGARVASRSRLKPFVTLRRAIARSTNTKPACSPRPKWG